MFHQDHGGKFASGNKRFEVGGEVFANLNSNYTGLFGYVTEIRRKDGQDTPEICCSFTPQKTLDGPYTRERYVSKQWSHLKKLDEPELEGVVMTPEILEAIPHSIPKRAGAVYALSYFSDGDDGCRYGTLSVSQDVGVLLRAIMRMSGAGGLRRKQKNPHSPKERRTGSHGRTIGCCRKILKI